jgi:vesicular inhibitory amino acid transporter
LATRPVNITLELMLGLEERLPPTAPDDHTAKPRTLSMTGHRPNEPRLNYRRAGVILERITFTLISIGVSIWVPEFSSMMAFIGSCAAFLLCIIGWSCMIIASPTC